ncbi:MAG: metallophosphoesterase, partial [Bacteroidetes bacterium]|nr:metallophosphoesterase [Bacteroidota bacterium]
HGCVRTLKFLIEQQIKPEVGDELFFLGDYIDRGPDSKGVIDYIMGLQEAGHNLKLLMGNHEDYCIRAYEEDQKNKGFMGFRSKTKIQKEWETYGGKEALESFKVDSPRDIPQKYIDWMRKLQYYALTDDFVIVHAGLNFKEDDPFSDTRSMLWIRDYQVDKSKIRGRRVIHGHVPVNLEFIDTCVRENGYKFIDLDNGVYFDNRSGYGNLVALELTEMRYVVQSLMDEITFKAR